MLFDFKLKTLMNKLTKLALALPLSFAVGAIATAAPSFAISLTYADTVEVFNPGSGINDPNRRVQDHALDAPQLNYNNNQHFLSLGYEGEAIFSFGTEFHEQVTVWETTWGTKSSQSQWDERIDVFVGNNLDGSDEDWRYIGEIFNISDQATHNEAGATLTFEGSETYQYVRLVDKSPKRLDGFDVNAVGVKGVESKSVPEPSSALSLLALSLLAKFGIKRRQNI